MGQPPSVGWSSSKLFAAYEHSKNGSYFANSRLDGLDRLYVYREVRGYPLLVVIGLAEDELFGAYEHNRRTDIAVASFLTLWLLGMTLLILAISACGRIRARCGGGGYSGAFGIFSHDEPRDPNADERRCRPVGGAD